MTLAHERHHEAILQAVASIETPSGIYTNEIVDATGLHKEIITNWLKANNFQKTGESRKCACGRTYTLPLPYDAANPEIRDLCPGLGGVPPCVPAISTPAPEPDEKCEVCGNPLEYHNNAYRWCKNMHSFRYFQTPHTSAPAPTNCLAIPCPICHAWTFRANIDEGYQILCSSCGWKQAVLASVPAPDLHSVIMKTESEIAADKLNEAAYTRGKIDGAKAERDREQPFIDFAKSASLKHSEMVDLMRRNNLKIDDLEDPMQKLAFTFFSEIGEMSHEAEVIIDESLRSQKEPQQ